MTPEIKERIAQIRRGEVPEGYKKVSNKIIPKLWKVLLLCKLGESKNGINFHSNESGVRVYMLGVGDFKNGSILKKINTISQVELSTIPADNELLCDGDIVFVRSNGSKELVGRNLLVYPGHDKLSFSGFCIRYRLTNTEETTPEYLNFLLDSGILKEKLKRDNQGSNINNLNQVILGQLEITIPHGENEQQKIAAILTAQDKVIELKEKLIAEKQRQKKYLMQQLLTGKKRLPGFSGKWKKVKLNQVLIERNEKNDNRDLQVCSVAIREGIINQVKHLGRSFAAKDTSNYGVVYEGDVVYTKSPTGEFPFGIVKQSQLKEAVVVSPLYGIYEPVSFAMGYILHTYFSSPINAKNYLLPIVQKGAKNTINITNKTFISNSLYLPMDFSEQKALEDIFVTADREINLLQQELEQEKQKKKALMQLLLTGIVRVNV